MKILAGIFGFIAVVYLAAWLYSPGSAGPRGGPAPGRGCRRGAGALTVYCRRAQEQRDRIEEKLDELLNKKGDAK